jgi:hypothetical protein
MKKTSIKVEKMTTPAMELCLVNPKHGAFPFTRYMVLPRSRWGINGINHECDMLALSTTGTLHEIEIKISKSDFLADLRKRHKHKSKIIKRLWYAVPTEMTDYVMERLPEGAGLIRCENGRSYIMKRPKTSRSGKLDESVIKHMYELLQMRYWSEKTREFNRIQKAAAKAKKRKS